jgi:hypothetical protein
MLSRSLQLLALGAVAAIGTAAPAAAGGCCACASACGQQVQTYQYVWQRAYVAVPVPVAPTPIYIVNQGPVYTGPGIHTLPQVEEEPDLVYPQRHHVRRHHVHQRTVQVERPSVVYRDRVVTRRVSKDPTPRWRPTAKRPFNPADK